jgi:hypothetical protein
MKNKIVLHVGFPKTGSSFLKEKIFLKLKEVNLINTPDLGKIEIDTDKINLIRDDGWSGVPTIDNLKYQGREYIDKLQSMFPDAKVIIGIREKTSWMNSYYRHIVKCGLKYTWDEWNNLSEFEKVNMTDYVTYLKSKFKDVYVYDFEDFKKSPDKIVDDICKFIGVEVPNYKNEIINPGWTDVGVKISLPFNKLFRTKWNKDAPLPMPKRFSHRYFLDKFYKIKMKIKSKK